MARSAIFALDEWYHCYSRGVDKRIVFADEHDSERFLMLLYIANQKKSPFLSNLGKHAGGPDFEETLQTPRNHSLVDLGAYCLMTNHYHLLIREREYGGISKFMQKVNTAYTMYFNLRHKRSGVLFDGRFKAQHVSTDQYLRRAANYIHANPAELYEPDFKKGVVRNVDALKKSLLSYRFSSLPDYERRRRIENSIVDTKTLLNAIESAPRYTTLVEDALIYQRQQMVAAKI